MDNIISWNNFHWEYKIFGSGQQTLFAFHGFDNDADDFSIFEKSLGKKYRIIAINLFYHGKSSIDSENAETDFSPEELKELFNHFLFEFQCTRFSLIGFSLGGRIVLKLLEEFPERIDRVILLAPDGLFISGWYLFVTHNTLGKWIFRRVVRNPSCFLVIARILKSIRLIGSKQYAFAMANFDTPEKRKKVFEVWMIFRHILPELNRVRKAIESYQIKIDLLFGKYDTIIRPAFGINFLIGLEGPAKMDVLDMGHNLMKEKLNVELERIVGEE